MDFQIGIKYPVSVHFLSAIEMIIGCSFYVNIRLSYCITIGCIFTDTQNITPTPHEEYHPRQFTRVEYYCLQTLHLHTEETPASQLRVYNITFIEHSSKAQVYKVRLIITFLIFIILTY